MKNILIKIGKIAIAPLIFSFKAGVKLVTVLMPGLIKSILGIK